MLLCVDLPRVLLGVELGLLSPEGEPLSPGSLMTSLMLCSTELCPVVSVLLSVTTGVGYILDGTILEFTMTTLLDK